MQRNRRRFLSCLAAGSGATVAGAGWWLASSKARAARWARRLANDARRKIEPAPLTPVPSKWSDNRITMAWLGHSTMLINFFGLHILTDPVLGNRCGISMGLGTLGPKRYVSPALTVGQLPPIDVVLLSHAHMDHMDLPTLGRLASSTQAVTAKATGHLLHSAGLKNVTELGWNERITCSTRNGQVEIQGVQVKHWGERWPSKMPRGYNGYVLRREGKALLFGGDTALTATLGELKSNAPYEVAIMPIGAYRPWIWNHCTPEQALLMADAAGAKYLVPVHHQTFRLSDEPKNEPIERLQAALHTEPERLGLHQIGGTFECPAT